MKQFSIILLFLLANSWAYAQDSQHVQWADTVLGFSSEKQLSKHYSQLHPLAFKAKMALGKPDIMPGNEGTGKVWQPNGVQGREWIKLGFKEARIVRQIIIAEVFSPSALNNIWLYTVSGKEIHLDFIHPRVLPDLPSRLLSINIDPTSEPINAIKIELDNTYIPGVSGIDAVAISNSSEPVEIFAKIAQGVHTALDPEKMDENINSDYKDIKPLLSPDGNTMFYSRINHPENIGGVEDVEDIWMATRDPETNEWNKAVNPGSPLNNEGPNFIASLAPSGYTYQLLLGNKYLNSGKMVGGLSITTKTSDGFTEPEEVEIEGYENFSERVNYHLGADGKSILMSIQARDSKGDRDIYISFLEANGKWSFPLNLGSTINTSEEESSPYLSADGKTLFFSSKGHLGYGGLDVFISKRLDDTWTNWSPPENVGTAINSPDDDMFFYLTEYDKKYAYFTRGYGEDADIYRLLLPIFMLPDPVVVLQGRVLNKVTGDPVYDARISFRELTEARIIVSRGYSSKEDASYRAMLPFGKKYELYASQEGYITLESEEVDLSHIFEPDTIDRNIYLAPIEVGQRIPLDNIYFDYDKASLTDASIHQLDLIHDFMLENPNVKIELDGHTCNMGNDDYNQKLSERRAQSVRSWLIDKGVRGGRIKSVGYGEARPMVSNETEEGRERNRRVEFIIIEK